MFASPIVRRFLERRLTPRRRWTTLLSFELLEDRTVPASIVAPTTNIYQVTSTADSGPNTLRDILAHVNADPLNDTEIIDFNIAGVGVQTIQVAGDLQITRAVTINGLSENAALGIATPGVLSIRLQGTATAVNGLVITGSGSTIQGIEFVGFHNTPNSAGIVLGPGATNNTIVGDDFGNIDNDIGSLPPVSPVRAAAVIFGNGGPPPNDADSVGIYLGNGSHNNTIGGALASAANVISGNALAGIVVSGSDGNQILGNDIGTLSDGVTALGNAGPGIRIDGSSFTTIAGNVIADNGTSQMFGSGGVHVGSGNSNTIESNSIHDNAGLGIDLDGAANDGILAPSIDEVSTPAGNVIIQGTYRGAPYSAVTLQFFANAAIDPSGAGEGRTQIGSNLNIVTDATGKATFTYAFAGALPPGEKVVTATATDAAGDTSQFSNDFTAVDNIYVTDPNTVLNIAAPGALAGFIAAGGQSFVSKVKNSAASVGVPVPGTNGSTFTINADGSFTFVPGNSSGNLAIGQSKTSSISYSVFEDGHTISATLQVVVAPIDFAPTLTANLTGPQTSTVSQRIASFSVAPAFDDIDADAGNDSLTYSDLVTPPGGQVDSLPAGLSINAHTGVISGTVTATASQTPYQVVITATDKAGMSVSETFDWTIVPPPPQAVNDTNSTDQDTVLTAPAGGVLANDTGDGMLGANLTVAGIVGGAAIQAPPGPDGQGYSTTVDGGGILTIYADGSYTFDPNGDYDYLAQNATKTVTVTYTAQDQELRTASAALTITIVGLDDAPIASAIPPQSNDDGDNVRLPVAGYFSDVDHGDSLTYSDQVNGVDTLPPGLTINPNTGVISGHVADDASQQLPYSVTITATDSSPSHLQAQTTFSWTVANSAPVAHADSATTDQNTPIGFGFDGNTDPATIDAGANVTVNDTDVDLADPLHVTQVSPDGNFDDTVLVTPQQPAVVAGSNGGAFTIYANGNYSFDPGDDFKSLAVGKSTTTSLSYQVADSGGTDTATLTVHVSGLDDPPSLTGASINPGGQDPNLIQSQDDDTLRIATRGLFTDIDTGDAGKLTYSDVVSGAHSLPPGLSIDPSTGLITGQIDHLASQTGTYDVTITATDPSGESVSYSFVWIVTNPPPVTQPDSAATDQNTPIGVDFGGSQSEFNVLANDTDDDDIHVSAIEGSDGVVVPIAIDSPGVVHVAGEGTFTAYWNGDYSFDPDGDFTHLPQGTSATTSITYFAEDVQGAVTPGTLTVRVNGLDDAPTIADPQSPQNPSPKTYSVDQGKKIRIPLSDFDPQDIDDGDTLHVTFVGPAPTSGRVHVEDTNGVLYLVYHQRGKLNPTDVNGILSDEFGFEVTDEHGVSSPPVTVHITINDVPPTATLVPPTGPLEGTPFTISMTHPVDVKADKVAGLHYYFAVEPASAASPNAVPALDLSGVTYASTSTSRTSPQLSVPDNGVYYVFGVVIDQYGEYTVDDTQISVANVAPTATTLVAPLTIDEGSTFSASLSGVFDPGTIDTTSLHYDFAVDGVWQGGVSLYAGGSTINSMNFEFDDGSAAGTPHTITERVLDKDGGFDDYTSTFTVENVAPTATLVAPTNVNEASVFSVGLSNPSDPSMADTNAKFRYALEVDGVWLDLPQGQATPTYADSGFGTSASQNISFDDGPSTHTIVERILDKDGGFTDYSGTITVANVAPTAEITIVVPAPGTAALAIAGHDVSTTDSTVGLRYSIDFGDNVFIGDFKSWATSFAIADDRNLENAGTVAVPTVLLNTNVDLQVVVRVFDKDGGFTDYFVTVPHNTPEVIAAGGSAATTVAFEQSTHSADQATDKALGAAHELLTVDGVLVRIEHGAAVVVTSDENVDSRSGGQNTLQLRQQMTHIVTPTGLLFELNENRTTAQIESLLTIPSSLQAGDDSVDLIVDLLGPPDESTSPIRWAGLDVEVDANGHEVADVDVAIAQNAAAPAGAAPAAGLGGLPISWAAALVVAIALILGGLGWFLHRRRAIEVMLEATIPTPPSENDATGSANGGANGAGGHGTLQGGEGGQTIDHTAPGSVPDTST